MLGHFSYLGYMLIFVFLALAILWGRYYRELFANKGILIKVVVIAVIYQLIVDPIAESWKAWAFSSNEVLGIWFINFPIENTIFFALNSFAIASAVIGFITHQKRHRADLS